MAVVSTPYDCRLRGNEGNGGEQAVDKWRDAICVGVLSNQPCWRCFMQTCRFQCAGAAALAIVLVVAGARPVAAIALDFENPPYTTGSVVGQDGWALTGYFPTLNGTVNVSTTNPLAGSQSLS